ncbi:hypothetical protein AB0O34_03550 [Sphaerisporangium sp. NPDC088356]|uniref:hypothetical protein n=1 Tax=Sphaerisporangium sp. NPDC088356 TaxID=3154871 RepID=UPI00342009F4
MPFLFAFASEEAGMRLVRVWRCRERSVMANRAFRPIDLLFSGARRRGIRNPWAVWTGAALFAVVMRAAPGSVRPSPEGYRADPGSDAIISDN